MEEYQRENSQSEMLKEQLKRVDDELLIFLKRRIQGSKKLAEAIKKEEKGESELNEISDELFKHASSKAKEMGLNTLTIHDIFSILDDECKIIQKETLNK